jgi:ubiquinone/menaquinone biosynthesis C-methylase UbiE
MGFDSSTQNYLNSSDHAFGNDLELIQNYFLNDNFELKLDIATAAGHFTKVFNSDKTLVVDLSYNMLKTAIENYDIDLAIQAFSHNLPFKNKTFDLISCRIALHHFDKPKEFFIEVSRCLKENGLFVLIDSIVDIDDAYLNHIEFIRDNTHIRSYTFKEIIDFAEKFRLEYFHTQYKKHNFYEWASRLNQSESKINQIEESFKKLPQNIKKELNLIFENNRLIHYTDKKGIFIFKKLS